MTTRILHGDLWGKREEKYAALLQSDVSTTDWTELKPQSPFYLFKPLDTELLAEYERGWKITDALPVNGVGMTTARDKIVIDFEASPIIERARFFRDSDLSDKEVCRQLGIPLKKGWNIRTAREAIGRETNLRRLIRPVLYRPFDTRLIIYHDSLVWRTVKQIMRHILAGENLGIIVPRRVEMSGTWRHVLVSRHMLEHVAVSLKTIDSLLPLYLYPSPDKPLGEGSVWPRGKEGRVPNLNPEFVAEMEKRLKMEFVTEGGGDLNKTFGPEDVFHYMYAVFHSPTYRTRYAEFLRIDFPRLPLTSDRRLFRKLCTLGAELVSLHLMESPELDHLVTNYPVSGDDVVEKGHPKYLAPGEPEPGTGEALGEGRVYISRDAPKGGRKGQYFDGVPPEVWEFHVGGYQVCEKWLKDRRGRKLSHDDLIHYQKIVVALKNTLRLMAEIDETIPTWPMA